MKKSVKYLSNNSIEKNVKKTFFTAIQIFPEPI